MRSSAKHFRHQQDAVLPEQLSAEALRGLRVPTLILLGENELIYDSRAALDRARELIPDVEAELVPDSGHMLNLEREELVSSRILEFLGTSTHGSR